MRARGILNRERMKLKNIAQQLKLSLRRRFQIEPEQSLLVREQRRQRRPVLTMNSVLTFLPHNRQHGNPRTSAPSIHQKATVYFKPYRRAGIAAAAIGLALVLYCSHSRTQHLDAPENFRAAASRRFNLPPHAGQMIV